MSRELWIPWRQRNPEAALRLFGMSRDAIAAIKQRRVTAGAATAASRTALCVAHAHGRLGSSAFSA